MKEIIENAPDRSTSPVAYPEKTRFPYYNDLMRRLFYACEKCDGALIQTASCIVCRRTSIRECVRCATISRTAHTSCEIVESRKHSANSTLGVKN